MKVSFKKNSHIVLLLNYIGRLLSAISLFILLPTFLGLEQLGLYAGIHHMVFLFAKIDLGQGIIRYGSPLQNDRKGKAGFLGWIWVASTFLYGLVITIFFLLKSQIAALFAPKAPEVMGYMPLIIMVGYIVLMNVMLKAWYIALSRVAWPSFFQHVVLNLLIIALILAYGWGFLSFEQLLIGTALPYTCNLGLLLIDLWRRGELYVCWDRRFFNKPFISGFLYYCFFTILAGGMSMLMIRIDNIMVFSMCGKKAESMYHTVTFMVLLLEIPMKVVRQTSASQIAQLLQKEDYKVLGKLYQQITQWQLFLTSACFTLLYTYIDYLLYTFPTDVVSIMKPLFLLLGIAKLLDNLFRTGSEILLLSRYFMWSLIIGGGLLLVGTLANYYMIQATGMYGASIATGIMLLLGGSISCGLIWYRLGIHPWSWHLLYWTAVTLSLIGAQYALPAVEVSWIDLFVRTSVLFVVYVAAWRVHSVITTKAHP